MCKEVWKDIENYEGYYQVSNLGRVRSLDREIEHRGGLRKINGRVLVPQLDAGGYHRLTLSSGGRGRTNKVHRLVAKAFHPNENNLRDVNHKNLIKTDNRCENLEWVSQENNLRHAFRNGAYDKRNKRNSGENGVNTVLTQAKVDMIRELLSYSASYHDKRQPFSMPWIAKCFQVSISAINHIKQGRTWKTY